MTHKLFHNKATSTIEYTVLLIILLATFLAFQKYMVRGFVGRWKEMGDAFGYGKQYDPKKTVECGYSTQGNFWYGKECSKNCQDTFNIGGCIVYCCTEKCEHLPPMARIKCFSDCVGNNDCNIRCKEFGRNCCMCKCDTEPAPPCEDTDVCGDSHLCGPYSCAMCP